MRSVTIVVALCAAVALASGSAWSQDYLTQTVPPTAPYRADLQRMYELGIVIGDADGSYRPDDHVERAELWVALNRLIDVCRMQGLELPEDYEPYLATYGRGVRDHWGFEAWERMTKAYVADRRPVALMMNLDAPIKRQEFARLAVGVMRGYGALPKDLTPAEVAIGEDIMVRQSDGYVHFQEPMPRWELAVCLSRLLDHVAPGL